MTNPIPDSGLFASPRSLDDLIGQIERISNRQERARARSSAFMALNTAHNLVAEQRAMVDH